jgi:RNA ligase
VKYQLDILNQYIEKGLVVKQDHPTLPISIYNYSRTCQYERLWDEITMDCRGLVLDYDGNVVAKPFRKFFNFEELTTEQIPNEPFEVFEKMDGSLGILFNYKGEWVLSTKGSFTSEQSIKGMEILKKYKYDRLLTGYTYLFEIIYPENRIVCQYDFEDLILLGVIDNRDGYEIRIHDNHIHLEGIRLVNLYNNLGFKIVKKYDGIRDYSELKSKILQNQEGFVIKFRDGFRMKIKGDEYIRLHRILTNFSTTDIWELLRTKGDMDEFLDRVPDEFDMWVKTTILKLMAEYVTIEDTAKISFEHFKSKSETKKDFALMVVHDLHSPILFSMWNGKPYEHIIWKMIKPKWSKPFKKDLDI